MIINRDHIVVDAPPPVDAFPSSTDTLREPPRVEYVIITVDGGCVQDVYNDKCEPVDYSIIDQDCLEGGQCPTCWEMIDDKAINRRVAIRNWLLKKANKLFKTQYYVYADTYDWCPRCKVNWDDPPTIEVQIQKIQEARDS